MRCRDILLFIQVTFVVLVVAVPGHTGADSSGAPLQASTKCALPSSSESIPKYGMPSRAAARGRMDAAASRAGDEVEGTLYILAPKGWVGQTTSAQPTLVWYVPEQLKNTVTVTLNHPKQADPVVEFSPRDQRTGFHCLSLAAVGKSLESGVTYNWNVAITADSGESVAPKVWAAKIEHANSGDTSSSWYDLVPTVVQGRESGAGNEAYWDELMRTLLEHGKLEKLIEVLP